MGSSDARDKWLHLLPAGLRARLLAGGELRAVATTSAWMSAQRIVQLGVSFAVGLWVARYLGPARFGKLSYAFAFVTLFATLSHLGLNDIVVRELVRGQAERARLLATAFALQGLGGLLVMVFANGAAALLHAQASDVRGLVAITSVAHLFGAFTVVELHFRARVEAKPVAYARSLSVLVTAAARVVLVVQQAPLWAFAWMGALELALAGLLLSWAYRATGGRACGLAFDGALARHLLRDSWPLILSGLVTTVYMRIDQVMLRELTSDAEVGAYAVAIRMSEVFSFLAVVIATASLPAIISAKEQEEARFYSRLQQLYNAMALCGYLVAIPLTLLAEPLVRLLFGDAYRAASGMLVITVWSGLFVNLGVARSSFLTAMNWTRTHTLTVSLGALLNVALNLWLIPPYGGRGAAIASLMAYWFAAHGACFVYPPLFRTGRMLTRALLFPKVW